MAAYVMVTVDLNRGVTEDQRTTFNAEMKKMNWVKLKLTTTWSGAFARETEAQAIAQTKSEVAKAAAAARITNYEAAAQAGTMSPSAWTA